MTSDEERVQLPASIGGLVDLAFGAYVKRARFYLTLALIAFVIQAALEFAIPAAKLDSLEGQIKFEVILYAGLVVDAFIVAAVALGIGNQLAGESAPTKTLAASAAERWLPVFIINLIVLLVAESTVQFNGFGPLPDPPWVVVATAPLTWLVLGVLGLAGPFAALSGERIAGSLVAGLTRAVAFSLHPANFGRLCIIAFATIVPSLLQVILIDWLVAHHAPRALFWGNVPIDALTVGPLAALQTVFALDFARRAGALSPPRR